MRASYESGSPEATGHELEHLRTALALTLREEAGDGRSLPQTSRAQSSSKNSEGSSKPGLPRGIPVWEQDEQLCGSPQSGVRARSNSTGAIQLHARRRLDS